MARQGRSVRERARRRCRVPPPNASEGASPLVGPGCPRRSSREHSAHDGSAARRECSWAERLGPGAVRPCSLCSRGGRPGRRCSWQERTRPGGRPGRRRPHRAGRPPCGQPRCSAGPRPPDPPRRTVGGRRSSVRWALRLTHRRHVANAARTGRNSRCSPRFRRSMIVPAGMPAGDAVGPATSPSRLPGDPMIALIAIAALVGAVCLGLRRPAADPVQRADPNLWPDLHDWSPGAACGRGPRGPSFCGVRLAVTAIRGPAPSPRCP